MNYVKPATNDAAAHRPSQRRAAGAMLIAGPMIYFLAEFITAAAWTDPPYSYTYHFISNLGVRGPSEAFGQYMYSPLAWVMNTGFFLFGITVLASTAMLRELPSRRRWALLLAATLLAVGGVLLAFFPGSGETVDDGTGDYHSLGAFAAFIGGNVLAILLGRMHRLAGFSRKIGTLLVTAGVLGLTSMVAFFVDLASANILIGLVERGVIYPFLVGLICAGVAIWNRWTPDAI